MPDIYVSAQIEFEECAGQLEDSDTVSARKCAQIGRDAEAAVRTLQISFANAAPGLKSRLDDVADEITNHVDHLVSEGPLNSRSDEADSADVERLQKLTKEARDLADEFQDQDVDLDERRDWTTMSERFEAVGRTVYDHPDLMEEPLEELFRRESNLEPPLGRLE